MAANSLVKVIETDQQFQPELNNAGAKLVVVDFTASWCGPCQRIAPAFASFSTKYPAAVFLKVDVDKCEETASKYGITAMPTFQLFKAKVRVDELKGADEKTLEDKIKKWIGNGDADGDSGVKGQVDLVSFINKSGCDCLNIDDEHQLSDALTKGPGYIESDCDEQILISVAFNQAVKLHSLRLQAPDDGRGPKTVKVFINQPNAMDFDSAENFGPVQTLELNTDDLTGDAIIPLKYVKLQNVQNVTFFVKDNQGGEETSVINYLCIIGSPLDTTNMSDFKRVAGKKGESH